MLLSSVAAGGVRAAADDDRIVVRTYNSFGVPAPTLETAVATGLLGSDAHSPFGLMRSFWLRDSLVESRVDDWRFIARQAGALRAAVARRAE